MIKDAVLSDDHLYRYDLTRYWREPGEPERGVVTFIGLNPSTADAQEDDPTIRRCIGFARQWGYDGLHMVNLFAYRATNPKNMKAAPDPVGPDNDRTIRKVCYQSETVVACWGAHGEYRHRGEYVASLFPVLGPQDTLIPLHCLGCTKAGHPRHPLYLRKDTELEPYGY